MLFELGQADELDVVGAPRMRSTPATSRLLARLERRGLVARERSPLDGAARSPGSRRAAAAGSPCSTAARAERDLGAAARAGDADRRRLVAALAEVPAASATGRGRDADRRAARAARRRPRLDRPPPRRALQPGVRLERGLQALVARIVADYAEGTTRAREAAWIAEVDGAPPAACSACARTTTSPAAPAARRAAGARARARRRGWSRRVRRVRPRRRVSRAALWTNDLLVARPADLRARRLRARREEPTARRARSGQPDVDARALAALACGSDGAAGPPTSTPEPSRTLAPAARCCGGWKGVGSALVGLVAAGFLQARRRRVGARRLGGGAGRGLAVVVVPELRWRRWRWEVREHEIDIRHGMLAVTRTLVPMLRVQHVDTTRGILQQWLGLATVVFHTAAGANEIPALTVAEAGHVRDRIAELARTADEL